MIRDDDAEADRGAAPADEELAGPTLLGTGLFEGPFDERAVDEAIERLASAGIAVHPDDGGPAIEEVADPASPLLLLRWQARNLTLEAASGGGLLGSDLDALVVPDPAHPGAPPPAQVLAAYVHGVDSPGAVLARELVGEQDLTDPDTVVFPTMVLTLFASDLARAAAELAEEDAQIEASSSAGAGGATAFSDLALGPVEGGIAHRASPSQPVCPDFAGFINEVISGVVQILKLPRITVPSTGIPILTQILQAGADLFVGFLNFAIDAAAELIIDGFNVLLQPVFSVVTSIAAVFAVTSKIVSAVRPWAVQATAEPDPVHRGVGSPALSELTVQVSVPGPMDWPDFIQSCAQAVQLDLPPLRPTGGRVAWSTIDPRGVAIVSSKEETLDDTSSARLVLDVGEETAQQHARGTEEVALVKVTASIRRQEVEDFKTLVRGLVRSLFSRVPLVIRDHLTYYSTHAVDELLDGLSDQVADPKAFVYLTVTFHGPPRPEEASAGAERAAPACPDHRALSTAVGATLPAPVVTGGEPELRVARSCQYHTDEQAYVLITFADPSLAWPTPGEIAAGIFGGGDATECDPTSVGQPVQVPGADRAMVYCRATVGGGTGLLVQGPHGIFVVFAPDDRSAVASSQLVLDP